MKAHQFNSNPLGMLAVVTAFVILQHAFPLLAADTYWSGGGSSDDFGDAGNWYNNGSGQYNPNSGDNINFNSTTGSHTWAYDNYGAGAWFGNIISYNGAGYIKVYGNTTYCYKFENNNNGSLFEATADLSNRTGPDTDLQINPVGSGGVAVNNVILQNGKWLYVYGGNTLTVNGVISQTGGTSSLVAGANGATTVILKGANTYSGGTAINAGTVSINLTGGLGTGTVTLGNASGAAATVAVNGASGSNAANLTNAVTVAGTGLNTISGTWTSSGQINLLPGAITLSSANLTINAVNASGWRIQGGVTGTGSLNFQDNYTGSGAVIDIRSTLNNVGAITNSGTGNVALNVNGASSGLIGANVTNLVQNSSTSPFTINAASSSFAGTAQVLAGTMALQNASALSVNNTVSVASGATMDIQDVSETLAGLNNVSGSGGTVTDTTGTAVRTLTLGGSGSYSFSGLITATTLADMAVAKSGGGTQTLTGANTYAGGTTFGVGQLNINYGGSSSANSAIGTGAFTINGGTIDNTSSGDVTLQPAIAQNWNGDFTYAGSVHNLNLGIGAVALGANRNITVSANTLTVGGNVSGAYSLTKSGAGNLLLTGANSYTGATTVGAGSLVIGGGSTSNSAALTVGNTAGSVATMTITNATLITGAASYVGSATGASSNQLTVGVGGVWNIGNQALRVASGGLVTNNTLLVTDGGMVTNVGVTYMSDNAGSLGNSLIISNNGQFISNDRVIVGQGGGSRSQQLIVAAGGKLYTTVNDSAIGNVNGLGNTATVTGAGSLWNQGGRNLRIGGNSSTAGTQGTNNVLYITSSGTVSNVASIYIPDYQPGVGNGIVISNGGQFYGGSLTLGQASGAVSNYYYVGGLGAASFATNTSVTVGGSAGTVGNQLVVTNATLRSGGTVTVGNNTTATNNSITVLAGGILDMAGSTLHSAAGVSNNLVVNGGVVTNVSGSFIWGDSGTAFGDTLTISNGGKFYASGGYMEIGRNNGSTSNSVIISGTGSVWDAGTKTMTIGGTSGSATGSVLTVASSGLFTNGSVTVSGNGGTGTGHSLVVNGGTVYANTLTVNSGGMVQLTGGASDLLYADVISGSSSMVITGAAVSASSVIAGWNNSSSSVGPLLTGNLALTKNGSGTLTLANANTYTGATIINAGTVSVSSDANLGNAPGSPTTGSIVINSGATLAASAGFSLAANRGLAIGPTSGTGGATLDVVSGTLTYNGIVADNGGSGMLAKTSTGNLLLGGANTYSGGTVISGGTLQLGSNTALGGGGATNVSGATLDLNGAAINNALSIAGSGVGGNGALVNNNTGAASTVSNNILGISFTAGGAGNLVLNKLDQDNTGVFTLTKVGAGTLYLSGTNLNYQMALTLNGGTVVLNKANANTTFDWAVDRSPVINSGTLLLGAVGEQIQTDQGLTMNGGVLDLGGFGQAINYLAGTGGMVTNSGATVATLTVGATQFGSTTANSTFAGVIADGVAKVALTKYGTNVITLAGANTYTGNTAINAGTLTLSGSASIASPTITIATNATLDVSAVTPTGFSLNGSGTLALKINKSGTTLTQGQMALGAKNLTYGGALTINASGDALANGDSFTLITKSSGTFSGWFSSVALPALATGLTWDTNDLATSGVLDVYNFTTNAVQTMVALKDTATTLPVSKLTAKTTGARGTVAVSSVSSASGATVFLSGGNINYTPPSGFTGTDTFAAVLSDGHGSITATVVVAVSAENVGPSLTPLPGDYGSFKASGMTNQTYGVEFSTSVDGPWADSNPPTVTAAANGLIEYTDSVSVAGHGGTVFYRLKQQ